MPSASVLTHHATLQTWQYTELNGIVVTALQGGVLGAIRHFDQRGFGAAPPPPRHITLALGPPARVLPMPPPPAAIAPPVVAAPPAAVAETPVASP